MEHLARARRLDPNPLAPTGTFSAMAHACFFLDRYEDALALAEQMVQHSPDAHPGLRIGAASAAFAGHNDSARRFAARLRVVDPAIVVSRLSVYLGPYREESFVQKYAQGLRLAGLPE